MAVTNITAYFKCSAEKVWNTVTSSENYSWRSDLEKIEVIDKGKRFIEYAKGGFATEFTIISFKPYELYEFDMENENMSGRWSGKFYTKVDFTESVSVKKLIMKPFAQYYLRHQQKRYISDLKKVLEKYKDSDD